MNALFITPSESGTGEAITARYMAERLKVLGHGIWFLASGLTAGLLRTEFPDAVTTFTEDRRVNQSLWSATLRRTTPDLVVFADYPLLFLASGAVPLVSAAWVDQLTDIEARLVTLDHLGYAQGPRVVYFGPPHLGLHAETFPALPSSMEIVIPCPVQGTAAIAGRRGERVRYWDAPLLLDDAERRRTRAAYLQSDDDFLVVHSTPGWAVRMAAHLGLPHYRMLPRLLERYLAGLPRPVTVVSVNDGALLPERHAPDFRIVNAAPMRPASFDALVLAADLVLTDNKVSVTLAKAACGIIPAVVLRNSFRLSALTASSDPAIVGVVEAMEWARSGSIFPHEVFPIWSPADLDELGLFSGNDYAEAITCLELFGGETTRHELVALLTDAGRRRTLADRQRAYVASLQRLPPAEQVMADRPRAQA
jgi:hypothetical protein